VLLATVSLLTVLLVVLTLLPLSRRQAWWIRGCDFPRLQLACAGFLLIALQLSTLDLSRPLTWLLLISCLACVAYQSWWIWPYSFLHRKEVLHVQESRPDNRIRVMIANVLMTNRNAGSLLQIIRAADPDVLVTVESDNWWQSQLAALDTDYRYSLKCPGENKYGMHLYSRLPLSDAQIRFLVEPDCPSMHALVTLRSGQQIQLHCLHPAPPSPTENDTSSERDAELIIVARQVAQADLPVIVTGDLNDVAWSATTRLFRKISGLLDPRVGRGMFNTFHAGYLFLRWPLDHLFHSRHFTLAKIRRLPGFGSDHFPILVELMLQPERAGAQEGIAPDQGDHAWAREKQEQANR
jgi:endonuclease/exonuclease/phosphatase (EEP) superfamily protein YafD